MANTGTLAIVGSIGGVSINKTISETGDHFNVYGDGDAGENIALTAGQAASSWVKTDADTAACNLTEGHGYSTGKMDVYWTGGMRYDVDVTVTVNALALDGGTGDDFPASASSDVIVCTHQQINTAIDGDECQLLIMNSSKRGHVHFEDADGDTIADIELQSDQPYSWNQSNGVTNPITGDPITVCYASNGEATTGYLTILSLEDSTPS